MPLLTELVSKALEFGKKGTQEVVEHNPLEKGVADDFIESNPVGDTGLSREVAGFVLPKVEPITPYEALRQYQVSSKVINKLLHDTKGNIDAIGNITSIIDGKVSNYGEQIKGIDSLINHPLKENRVLYRGLSMTPEALDELGKTKQFISDSYLSFSKAQNVSGMFARASATNSNRVQVILELKGGAGKAMGGDLDQILGKSVDFSEDEVLLARGQKFKVQSIYDKADDKYPTDSYTHVVLTPENTEAPLIYKKRFKANSKDQNVIDVPFANGTNKEMPIDQDPDILINKIKTTSDEDLEKLYPGIDVKRLRERIGNGRDG